MSDGLDYINVGKVEVPSRAYVSAFGFKGPDQQKPAKVLSGGERNRLNLALTLKMGGNVLLLDEPTNDLDVETLGSLENALLDFPGCAVITSHDRWFLDRVATHILAYEATPSGSGSRATSRATRRTRWSASAGGRPSPPCHLPQTDEGLMYAAKVALRWSDMDALGHINNSEYLRYFGAGAHRVPVRRRGGRVCRGRPACWSPVREVDYRKAHALPAGTSGRADLDRPDRDNVIHLRPRGQSRRRCLRAGLHRDRA